MGTFRLSRPTPAELHALFETVKGCPDASPRLLSLADGLIARLPIGFAHDVSRSELGRGNDAFARAREAMQRWVEFDIGWLEAIDPTTPIARGKVVGVLANSAGLWSVHLSRITETIDTSVRFGFLYTTTAMHTEEGQERFVIEFDPKSGTVHYLLEAVSRPRHTLARLGYPFTRAMQHRFSRDSHARMRRAVSASEPPAALPQFLHPGADSRVDSKAV
ncbi:MAG TPA: DUF1990 domain-containing protein [Terracidiphilus sp.]|nr:DUF1990 domain-containing protein [Terracidiphilus sp.]